MDKIRCWTCVGRGFIIYPYCEPETCTDCNGTGFAT